MQAIRERIIQAFAGGESVNRRLVLLVALITAAVVAILVSLNSAKPVAASQPSASASALAMSLPEVYVHVVGEVEQPGVYQLPSNSRLFDAIFAAGGFTLKADQGSVNLARQISDGEQIVVLIKGVASSPAGAKSSIISLNRGSQAELETLPGVGPTLAARMIDWRTTNGGFKSVDDLKKVSGIGPKLFAQIKPKVSL